MRTCHPHSRRRLRSLSCEHRGRQQDHLHIHVCVCCRIRGIRSGQRVILPSDISSSLFFLLFINEVSSLSMIHTRPRRKHDKMCTGVLYKHKPFVAEYVPAGHGAHVAASEELDPTGPYLPAAHREPEQVEAPVICTYIYINIHRYIYFRILYIVTHRRICMHIFFGLQSTNTRIHTHTQTHTHT